MVGGVDVTPTGAILEPVELSPVVPAWAAVAAVSPRRMRVSPTGKEDRRRGPRNPIRVRRANSSCVIKPRTSLSGCQGDPSTQTSRGLPTRRTRSVQELPNRSTARARARAASISRFRGPASVTSESNKARAAAVISLTARSNAASLARDGFVKPESFLTNWSEASRISSSVAGGSKLNSVLMFRHMGFSPGISGRKRRWEAVLNHVGLAPIPRRQISVVRLLSSGSMPTKSSEVDSAIGGPMRTNRSMPSSTVIPVLVYPDVAEAVDWLCGTFEFTEHLRIGSHRSQLTVGDGSIVVAADPHGPGIDSNKTREVCRSHQGETNHSVMVRVPNVDRHFERAKNRGAKILQPPTDYPFGERQYTAEDLGGHTWTFSQSMADVAPEEWGGTVVTTRG